MIDVIVVVVVIVIVVVVFVVVVVTHCCTLLCAFLIPKIRNYIILHWEYNCIIVCLVVNVLLKDLNKNLESMYRYFRVTQNNAAFRRYKFEKLCMWCKT